MDMFMSQKSTIQEKSSGSSNTSLQIFKENSAYKISCLNTRINEYNILLLWSIDSYYSLYSIDSIQICYQYSLNIF